MDEVYFQDIQPPAESVPYELTLDTEGDTLYIHKPTTIEANFKTEDLEIQDVVVVLGDSIIYRGQYNSVSFYLNPTKFTPAFYTLSIYFLTHSGSGSIADQVGQKGYLFERQWIVAMDGRNPGYPELNLLINEDGFMCIHWKPTDHLAFRSYSLRFTNKYFFRVYKTFNRHDTLVVLPCYNYGNIEAVTVVNLIGDPDFGTHFRYRFFPDEIDFHFEEISADSMIVSWNAGAGKTLYSLYTLIYGTLFSEIEDTSAKVKIPPLGRAYKYVLYYKTIQDSCYILVPKIEKTYQRGTRIAPINTPFAFNSFENIIYETIKDSLIAVDIESLNRINSLTIPSANYLGVVCCQYNSSKIAALSRENIYLFDNSQLTNPTVIPNTYNESFLEHFYYTSNNKIAGTSNGLYSMYDIASLNVENIISYDPYPAPTERNYVGTHRDGEFVTFTLEHKIQHYKIENQDASLIYENNTTYSSVLYSETEPDLIYLSRNDIPLIELRNATDFSLISTINLDNIVLIRNIDPVSSYMLLKGDSTIQILDLQTHEILLTLDSFDNKSLFFDSKIFLESGYLVDLKPYLP
jgi:hypothetical protein